MSKPLVARNGKVITLTFKSEEDAKAFKLDDKGRITTLKKENKKLSDENLKLQMKVQNQEIALARGSVCFKAVTKAFFEQKRKYKKLEDMLAFTFSLVSEQFGLAEEEEEEEEERPLIEEEKEKDNE